MKTDFYRIYKPIIGNLEQAFSLVLKEGIYIGGHYVDDLELKLASFLESNEVVCCKSGTHALMLSLLACDVGVGDEVITIGTTYYATAKAITNVGAKCVFCDCIASEGYLDEDACISAITDKTKAVIPVHLYGFPHSYNKLRAVCKEKNIAIIEDCSHAFGTRFQGRLIGAESEFACFSMYPTKNLGAFGDAGFVATTNKTMADRMRRLRYYADSSRQHFDSKAIHGRMDTLQAALIAEVIQLFPKLSERRRHIFSMYRKSLASCYQQLGVEEMSEIVPYEYPILCNKRDSLFELLRQFDIPVQKHYSTMLHMLPEFGNKTPLPNTEAFNNSILCLPVIPDDLFHEHTEYIINIVNEFGLNNMYN